MLREKVQAHRDALCSLVGQEKMDVLLKGFREKRELMAELNDFRDAIKKELSDKYQIWDDEGLLELRKALWKLSDAVGLGEMPIMDALLKAVVLVSPHDMAKKDA